MPTPLGRRNEEGQGKSGEDGEQVEVGGGGDGQEEAQPEYSQQLVQEEDDEESAGGDGSDEEAGGGEANDDAEFLEAAAIARERHAAGRAAAAAAAAACQSPPRPNPDDTATAPANLCPHCRGNGQVGQGAGGEVAGQPKHDPNDPESGRNESQER